jgi:NADPH2:quinone reductase
VTTVKAGDRVIGCLTHGAAREKIAAPASKLIKIPDALDFDRAAGLCITYGTTLHALKDRAKLRAGETLAVLGASGGAGLAAVELGKLMNARVIACASSDEKLAFTKKHGADDTINYGKDDLKDALRRLRAGAAPTSSTIRLVGLTPSRRCVRLPGRVGFSWLASPLATFRNCRSISCCSRAATWSAYSGARGWTAIRKAIAPIPNSCWPGAWTENCHRTFMQSIRWRMGPAALKALAAGQVMGKSHLAAVIWCGLTPT